ncbi:CD209 antigen [Fukomys damarensis]|uniref:CD209 antigen n=1 Tax=Fukomys damarensis TaxID=885580 RepID=A0A091DJJ8_FUKDA|nr:CD209 antigen [Fukomys damarensis]
MAGDHEPRVPGSPVSRGPWPLLLLLFLSLAICFLLLVTTLVQGLGCLGAGCHGSCLPSVLNSEHLLFSLAVSRIPKSPAAEAQDRQESPSLGSASQEQVQSGLEQIRQQLGQINASLEREERSRVFLGFLGLGVDIEARAPGLGPQRCGQDGSPDWSPVPTTPSSAARLCRPCPWNWEPFQGSCYLFSRTLGVWEASVSSCRDLGAHLVIINSLAEQRFLRYWDVRKDQRTWIGLSDHFREGSWQWVDGAPLQLSFWQDGEPNNDGDEDCVELFQDTWNDNVCTAQNFWICEQPVVPCTGL